MADASHTSEAALSSNVVATSTPPDGSTNGGALDRFSYDDAIVRMFFWATLAWGLVGLLVGVIIAFQLAVPELNVLPQ